MSATRTFEVSHPDKVMYPTSGTTKAEVAAWWATVADVFLAHVKGRGVTFRRYPGSVSEPGFWQQHPPEPAPRGMRPVVIPRDPGDAELVRGTLTGIAGMRWVAQMNALEVHAGLGREPHLDRPDLLVFDLDPGAGAGLAECCEVAIAIRDLLAGIDLECHPKLSGSKGMQLYSPIAPRHSFDHSKLVARAVAELLARQLPDLVVSKMLKALRANKVFVDWSQNDDVKTTISPWSLRATDTPHVSLPVTWHEVEGGSTALPEPTLDVATARLHDKGDLFAPVLGSQRGRLPPVPALVGAQTTRSRARRTPGTPTSSTGS